MCRAYPSFTIMVYACWGNVALFPASLPPCVTIAWASISTNNSGRISDFTSTSVVTGRISPKNLPWAVPISSHFAISVTNIRVRTTSFSVPPALTSASWMLDMIPHPHRAAVSHLGLPRRTRRYVYSSCHVNPPGHPEFHADRRTRGC